MKKIAAILAFVMSVQMASHSFAQQAEDDLVKKQVTQLEQCLNENFDYVRYGYLAADPKNEIEINETIRLKFLKGMLKGFSSALYATKPTNFTKEERDIITAGIVTTTLVGIVMTFRSSKKNIKTLKDILKRIDAKDLTLFDQIRPKNLQEGFGEFLKKSNPATETVDEYLNKHEKHIVEEKPAPDATKDFEKLKKSKLTKITLNKAKPWIVTPVAVLLALGTIYYVHVAYMKAKIKADEYIKANSEIHGKLEDLENATSELEFNEILGSDDPITSEVRAFAVSACKLMSTEDIISKIKTIELASDKQIQDSVKKVKDTIVQDQ